MDHWIYDRIPSHYCIRPTLQCCRAILRLWTESSALLMDLEWEDAGNGDWDVLLQDDDVVEEANGVHIEVTIEG